MTTPSTARKAGPFTGTGSQTAWPFTFKVFAAADVKVTATDANGDEVVLVLNTDYTVSVNENQETSPGGTVSHLLASGRKLSITGDVDYDQPLDLPSGGNFSPLALENQLDRGAMQIQQLREELDRAPKVPVTSEYSLESLTADLIRLADSADNIDAAVTNLDAINTVASDLNEPVSEINTVAGAIANVNTVGNNISNVNTVAGISANVSTVATNITAVNTAVTNIAAIIAAPSEAAAAAASAAAAAASAAAGMYSAVQDKSADYTVVLGDAGDLIRMTTTGGARTITLPLISSLPDGFNVTVVKWTGDTNSCTVARSGSDVINGGTSYVLDAQYKSATFVADFQTNTWFASGSGGAGVNISVDAFSGNGSTVAFPLSGEPGSENNTQVFVGGVYQGKDTYSLSGTTLTFSAAPPIGTSNIEVVWSQPLAIGVPGDGTVSTAKLQNSTVTTAKIADGAVGPSKLASGAAVANIGYTPLNAASPNFSGAMVGGIAVLRYVKVEPPDTNTSWVGATLSNPYTGGEGVSFLDSLGRNGVADSHIQFVHQVDNGSRIVFSTQGAGPNTDRRVERVSISSTGQMHTTTAGTMSLAYDARAWVNFNGTGTVAIRASGNVSSITDNGVGDYTLNFANAMSDANYAILGTMGGQNVQTVGGAIATPNVVLSTGALSAPTTSSCRIVCAYNGADAPYVNVAIFR